MRSVWRTISPAGLSARRTTQLEFQELDLRYQDLRVRSLRRERQLLASLSAVGQQLPIVVVQGVKDPGGQGLSAAPVLIDGFKRVRCLKQLRFDTVLALFWELDELGALLLNRSLRLGERESSMEQAWLLYELTQRFALSMEDLGRRFERSQSWVSRRLALVRELPQDVQNLVRRGDLATHAATKYLVPMLRADQRDGQRMARAIAQQRLSTREAGLLYAGWRDGDVQTRARMLADPMLYLRARAALAPTSERAALGAPRDRLLKDLSMIAQIARRAHEHLKLRVALGLSPAEGEGLWAQLRSARAHIHRLIETMETLQPQRGAQA